jgi:LPXTG-site transpeptidase (sortase) family protein
MTAMESAQSFWRDASPVKRGLLAAGSLALVVALSLGIAFVAISGGDDDESQAAAAPTKTAAPTATSTPALSVEQVLRYFAAVIPTPTPERAASQGAVARNPTSGAPPSQAYVPRPAGSGPGPITGTDMSISIPAIGVNASVYARSVGTNGQMGNPAGAWDVIWYDFSQNWPGLGGYPGDPGSNAVYAGHVDYIRVGPAVFWSVRNLAAGDKIYVNSRNGTLTYNVQWSQWAGPTQDFTGFVAQNGSDSITLVTCIGGFSGGHYSNRLIVRGIRE